MSMPPSQDGPRRASRRTGRRPGEPGTRQDILLAARRVFAQRGYSAATMRGIAHEAKVDAALLHHFFGSKSGLFSAAIRAAVEPAQLLPTVLAPGVDGLAPRLLRMFLGLWTAPESRDWMLAVLRSAVAHPEAAQLLREFLLTDILTPVAEAVGAPNVRARVILLSSHLVGLAMLRFVIRIEPVASVGEEDLIRALAPTLQYFLEGEL